MDGLNYTNYINNHWQYFNTITSNQKGELFGQNIELNHDGSILIVSAPNYVNNRLGFGRVLTYRIFPNGNYNPLTPTLYGSSLEKYGMNISLDHVEDDDMDLLIISAVKLNISSHPRFIEGYIDIFKLDMSRMPVWRPLGNRIEFRESNFSSLTPLDYNFDVSINRIGLLSDPNSVILANFSSFKPNIRHSGGKVKTYKLTRLFFNKQNSFTISPNPSLTNGFDIIFSPNEKRNGIIEIVDFQKRILYSQKITNQRKVHIMPNLRPGKYIIFFKDLKGNTSKQILLIGKFQ